MPELGQIIEGKYRLVRLLGQGGMGSVYEAHHQHIAKRVAVKFLKPELCERVEFTRRFLREAQAAAATGHKSIVNVTDIGQTPEGQLYLIMEFLEGRSLAELLEHQPVLPVSQSAYIACHVLSALAAAHEHGIVHRDVKPENIYLQETGQPWPEVKLLDFGASKISEGTGPTSGRLTATGIVLGTPYYMSPEQARGDLDVDHRADIYATGVLMYENLTGQLPFSGANYNAVMANVLSAPVSPPSMLRPDLPKELERVVLKAMSRNLSERYSTATEVLADLLPFVEEKATATIALPRGITWERLSSLSMSSASATTPTTPAEVSSKIDITREGFATPVPGGVPLWVVLAVTALVVAVLAVGGTLLAVYFGRTDEATRAGAGTSRPSKTVPPPPISPLRPAAPDAALRGPLALVAPADPTDASAGGATDAEVMQQAQDVTITLNGVPEGARVSLDGAPVDGPVLTVARGAAAVEVRVEVEGYRPWLEVISAESDMVVEVRLEPEPDDLERNGMRDGSRRDSSAKRHRTRDRSHGGQEGLKQNPFR